MSTFDFVITANSPGELSALVKPVAKTLKTKHPEIRIILVLTPCQYKSGAEVEFAKKLEGIDEIVSTKEYEKMAFLGPMPKSFNFSKNGIILYLGGDLMHPLVLAKRTGFKIYAYIAGEVIGWQKKYRKFFIPDQTIYKKFLKKGIKPEKMQVVGNLMVDSVAANPNKDEIIKTWKLDPHHTKVTFMPGSRQWEVEYMVPFFSEVAKLVRNEFPRTQLILSVSPFQKVENLEALVPDDTFDMFAPIDALPASDLAVTIPGTNTAQFAAMGIPMVVAFPLNKPEVIPMDGIAHYIGKIPVLGKMFKTLAADIVNKRTKFFALPNIKSDSAIVPEIRGKITPKQVAIQVIALLADQARQKKMAQELKACLGEPGAAQKIVEVILNESFSTAS